MITILHGDDIRKSRQAFIEVKQSFHGREVRQLDGKHITDQILIQALDSTSLFDSSHVVVIENVLTTIGRKTSRAQELTNILTTAPSVDIVLWEEKEIAKTIVSAFGKNVTVRLFKLPTILFSFLDTFIPGNAQALVKMYTAVTIDEPPDLIHSLLTKRIRSLLYIKSGLPIDSKQAWQLARLTNQARTFTLERLISLYYSLREIEFKRNSGQLIFDLKESTQRLIVEL